MSWVVLLIGAVILFAAVLSPMLWINEDRHSFKRKRALSGVVVIFTFVGFGFLYAYADRLNNPPAPEPPPPVTGSSIEAELIASTPVAAATRTAPKGVLIGPSGFGTILAAPPTEYGAEHEPYTKVPPLPGLQPADGAVAPEIAHVVRVLPRMRPLEASNQLVTSDLVEPPVVTGTIILRDGCFRLASKGEPLVLLPPDTRAVLDEDGYLILSPPGTARSLAGRVGETIWWYGPTLEVTNPAVTKPLRKMCGTGRVVRVGTSSDAVRKSERDASIARQISNMYGLPNEDARRQVARCQSAADRRRTELRRRYGDDPRTWPADVAVSPCQPPPPPPVANASDCPPRTTFRGGLCRNEKGFIVPVLPRRLF